MPPRRRSLLEMTCEELANAGYLEVGGRIGGRAWYRAGRVHDPLPAHVLGNLLSVEDVATLLQVHHRTVRTMVRMGELPSVRVGGKSVRFLFADIMRWIEARRR
jgi:excisionase family DNA binding protein